MATPNDISNAVGGFFTGNIGNLIVDVAIWSMIIGVIGVIFFLGYLLVTYKYKIQILHVSGSGSDKNPHTIGKISSDFARVTRDGSWKFYTCAWSARTRSGSNACSVRSTAKQPSANGFRAQVSPHAEIHRPVSYVNRRRNDVAIARNAAA